MQNQTTTNIATTPVSNSISKPLQLVAAFLLGTIIMYGVGFVNMGVVHNAAHDIRHSQGFPCH
jgi:cobalt transporter subunit CbtB